MNPLASPSGRSRGALVIAALVVVCLVAVGAWYLREAAWRSDLADALEPYAAAPLPGPDAPLDPGLAAIGADLFRKRCSACHTLHGGDRVGPDLGGVTERRSAAWIAGMILAPDSMTEADADARMLKGRYGVQMVTPEHFGPRHARAILEFLRQADADGPG